MITSILVGWQIIVLVLVTYTTFCALQKIDFEKVFKANSTWQIKFLIIIISLALGFIISLGFGILLKNIIDLFY